MSEHSVTRPRIGVGVILWRGEQVLLGKRVAEHGDYCWGFPGGHLEAGESVIDCAMRELAEETGLLATDPAHAGYTDRQFELSGSSYVTLYVTAVCMQGEAELREPGKCGGWQWFHYRELPTPLFEPISLFLHQHTDLRAACRCQGTPSGAQR